MPIINPSKLPNLKIVSLLSSATEIICRLGFETLLIGRSHECDYPLWIKDLPKCSEITIDATQPSFVIDLQIKSSLDNSIPIYKVNYYLINKLKPDIIVTQKQCKVCAVSASDLTELDSKLD